MRPSVAFFVAMYDLERSELERHPSHHPIEAEVPDAGFEVRNWTVGGDVSLLLQIAQDRFQCVDDLVAADHLAGPPRQQCQ